MIGKTFYGLWHAKHRSLLSICEVPADSSDEDPEDFEYSLTMQGPVWLVDSYEHAMAAANSNINWENSTYEHPRNIFYEDELIVVEVRFPE